MKIIIAVLSVALIAAVAFGISQKNKSESLTGQLTAAQSQSTKQIDDLKAAIATANTQSGNLQSQITAANDYAQKVQTQLDAANVTIAQLAPQAARARTLPLYVTWRRAMTGNGKVIQIHNTSGKPLPISIEASNATFGTKSFNHVASENIPTEIGVMEGWDFAPGDSVKISSGGFDAQIITCR